MFLFLGRDLSESLCVCVCVSDWVCTQGCVSFAEIVILGRKMFSNLHLDLKLP